MLLLLNSSEKNISGAELRCFHSSPLSSGAFKGAMYAFYSLLVYIFYTVFKKEELALDGEGSRRASDQV